MKKLLLQSFLALAVMLQLTSCKTQMVISNGAFSDISLVRDSKDYSIKRLGEINTESKAFFGIPVDKSLNKKQGIIFRFNGVNITGTKGFLPVLSMIGLSLTTGYFINEIVGYKKEPAVRNGITYNFTETSNKFKLGLGTSGYIVPMIIGSILAIPVSGAINNQIWSGSSYSRAAYNANSKLLQDNPNIDVFLNPKYEIERKGGLWTQHTSFKVKVMGAILKED